MAFEALKTQIKNTIHGLERGQVNHEDRVFLNHILEELKFILDHNVEEGVLLTGQMYTLAESTLQMLGSVNELVEDGLED